MYSEKPFSKTSILFLGLIFVSLSCSKKASSQDNIIPVDTATTINHANDVTFWLTQPNQGILLQKVSGTLSFGTLNNSNSFIDIDSTKSYQSIDGFGYTLTGGSATVINSLSTVDKTNLLKELFGNESNSIGVSYLRISIGASDLNNTVFSYDDVPAGQTDVNLTNFTLNPDKTDLIPLLKQILAINPSIKILAVPWSAPTWMKDNGSTIGGNLQPQYYGVYAQYFVKYILAMKSEGINIDAVTPQNEPLNPGNNPSLVMTALQQANFIKNNLGPAFKSGNISTKIIIYDHNCDHPDYPITILNDAQVRPYVDGSAFHLYAGDISALSQVHNQFPDKNVYFTEQYTASNGDFAGDIRWAVKNVVIGSLRNWSRNALEWNLANDPSFGPHTPGGCTTCKGAITIGTSINRNPAYYIIAHASKFIPAGSVRIESNLIDNLQNVAFKTPSGQKVMIVLNDGPSSTSFNIRFNNKWVNTSLASGAVGTYIW
ncbi:MAG: glucosylceramidase [Ginsengibacter sp.]